MPIDSSALAACLDAMRQAEEVIPLRLQVIRGIEICGTPVGYFVAPLTADARVDRIITSVGLPPQWERQYQARLQHCDPLLELAVNLVGTIRWPEDLDQGKLSLAQRAFMATAAEFGLGRGIGVACYGPNGRSGFLGGIWQHEREPGGDVLQALQAVGTNAFQRYCQLIKSPLEIPVLSARELEVLSWMCAGKSNPVIAQILGISRSTVDVYIRRIFAKLDVTDRTAASVRAATLGLVIADDVAVLVERGHHEVPKQGV